MLRRKPTNLLLLAAKQEPHKNSHLLTKNIEEFGGGGVRRMGKQTEKKDRVINRAQQKNKRGDSKVESNDSPEIPDKGGGGDIRHPRPPFGGPL